MDAATITKRIDELIGLSSQATNPEAFSEVMQGATSIITLVYGANSTQLKALQEHVTATQKQVSREFIENFHLISARVAAGVLKNVKQEIASGLIGSLSQRVAGDVLTDFIKLARASLDQTGDGGKNVAAVLAAAAFEDTVRRMGEVFGGITSPDDLSDILLTLKNKGVIQSPQIGIAQSYLTFRNHALHGNWDKIQRESVHSVLGFVEQLILKHFQ